MSYDLTKWVDIKGFEGRYQANADGRIRRIYSDGRFKILSDKLKEPKKGSRYTPVSLIDDKGKRHYKKVARLIYETFVGEIPKDMRVVHIGPVSENHVQNLCLMRAKDVGKKYGANSKRKIIAKCDLEGNQIEFYTSSREAGKKNYMNYQTILDRCNGRVITCGAPDGYEYCFADDKNSIKKMMQRIKKRSVGRI